MGVEFHMPPRHSRQLPPFWVPDLSFDPEILDALVGHRIDVDSSKQALILEFVPDPFALLRQLIEELVVRTRCRSIQFRSCRWLFNNISSRRVDFRGP